MFPRERDDIYDKQTQTFTQQSEELATMLKIKDIVVVIIRYPPPFLNKHGDLMKNGPNFELFLFLTGFKHRVICVDQRHPTIEDFRELANIIPTQEQLIPRKFGKQGITNTLTELFEPLLEREGKLPQITLRSTIKKERKRTENLLSDPDFILRCKTTGCSDFDCIRKIASKTPPGKMVSMKEYNKIQKEGEAWQKVRERNAPHCYRCAAAKHHSNECPLNIEIPASANETQKRFWKFLKKRRRPELKQIWTPNENITLKQLLNWKKWFLTEIEKIWSDWEESGESRNDKDIFHIPTPLTACSIQS